MSKEHKADLGAIINILPFVLFPQFPEPLKLIPALEELDHKAVVKLITEIPSKNFPYNKKKIEIFDHFVNPNEARGLNLDDVGTIRQAILAFAAIYIWGSDHEKECLNILLTVDTKRSFSEFKTSRQYLRALFKEFFLQEENLLQDYLIDAFAEISFEYISTKFGILDENGNTKFEKELFRKLTPFPKI